MLPTRKCIVQSDAFLFQSVTVIYPESLTGKSLSIQKIGSLCLPYAFDSAGIGSITGFCCEHLSLHFSVCKEMLSQEANNAT